ncbi:MAG: tyrosine-type recombinase/integrase [Dehalococcoidia bacterium]|nr:tyrosine-type recombinase/integrase [Dehalococcoidia bacterium]
MQRFLTGKQEEGLSAGTVRRIQATLRRDLNDAVRTSLLPRNVASLVTPPRERRAEFRPLTNEQVRKLLEGVEADRLSALYHVAMLGLRQGEILGLRWEHIDLEGRKLAVRRSLQRYGKAFHFDETKTARSRRTIPMPAPVVDAPRAHRTQQLEERLAASPAWEGGAWDLVFCRENGHPLHGSTVTHQFQRHLERLELPRMPFHGLRHGAASYMLMSGVPLRTVMEVLGHSEIGTTANIYAHLAPESDAGRGGQGGGLIWG